MTAVHAHQQRDMSRLLIRIARSLLESKKGSLAPEAIRELPVKVQKLRTQLLDEDDVRLIDCEAVCLLELTIALTYARDIKDVERCAWIETMMPQFIAVMESDLASAEKGLRP